MEFVHSHRLLNLLDAYFGAYLPPEQRTAAVSIDCK